MFSGRNIDKVTRIELEGRFCAENIEVDLGLRTKHAYQVPKCRVACVEGAFWIRGVLNETVVDERLLSPQLDGLVDFDPWKVLNSTSRHSEIVGDKVLRGVESSLRTCYCVPTSDVEVAELLLDVAKSLSEECSSIPVVCDVDDGLFDLITN